MANVRRDAPERISADCPHCGFSQLEAVTARSTFCRRCGEHFLIERLLAKEAASLRGPTFLDRLGKIFTRESNRNIACFSCLHRHEVPSDAHSSMCPKCGSYIDIRDFRIAGPFARTIQTQGTVHFEIKSDAGTAKVSCGNAEVEGRFRGRIHCTGNAAFKLKGAYPGEVVSELITVRKGAEVTFDFPMHTVDAEICGGASGIFVCEGRLTIQKKGNLKGTVYARSICVEKGGYFSGDLIIGQPIPEALRVERKRLWEPKTVGRIETHTDRYGLSDHSDVPPEIFSHRPLPPDAEE